MYPARVPEVRASMLTLRSRARVRVAEAGPAGGRPVFLLHGWGASVYSWRFVFPALAAAGLRAVGVDLRGHGLSDKPRDAKAYTLAAMLAHTLEVMDALELERPAVIGHSMGGRLALELAMTTPERVSALALLAPAGIGEVYGTTIARFPFPWLAPLAPELVRRWMISATLRACYGRVGTFTERDVDEYWAPSQYPGYARAVVELLRRFEWAPVPLARLAALRMPRLLVRGTLDHVVWLNDPKPVTRVLPSGALRLVPDVGHLPHEEAPEPVVPMLVDLLTRASSAAGSAQAG